MFPPKRHVSAAAGGIPETHEEGKRICTAPANGSRPPGRARTGGRAGRAEAAPCGPPGTIRRTQPAVRGSPPALLVTPHHTRSNPRFNFLGRGDA